MCGIAGFTGDEGEMEGRGILESMLNVLHHRGPDDRSSYARPGVALGTTRLSIVDLDGGRQPAVSTDHDVAVVFNGEIFNYMALRSRLIRDGAALKTRSEVETLLHLYLRHGPDMVRRLNGQFAIAIWDGRTKDLILIRDPFGIRPLFWHADGKGIRFASEIKSIVRHPHVRTGLDRTGILQTIRYWTVVGDRTVFRDIRQVPPGHYVVWRSGAVNMVRFWEWPCAHACKTLHFSTDAEYVEAFTDALESAVSRQTMADVPVAAYLSGGIDSAAVAACLSDQYQREGLQTYSIAFEDPEYDESEAQRAVANHLGVSHTTVTVKESDIAKVFPDVVAHAEAPLFRTAPAPLFLLSRRVHEDGLKVVLTGEGADEVLMGYDLFRETMIRRYWARQPDSQRRPRLLQRLYHYLPQYRQSRYLRLLTEFYRPTLFLEDQRFYAMAVRWKNNSQVESVLSEDMRAFAERSELGSDLIAWLPDGYAQSDDLERAQIVEAMTLLTNYLLSSQGDRMSMAHAVEGRYPFLDLKFVQFMAGMPRNLKLRGLRDKFVLRRGFADKLPDAVCRRAKVAYQAPEMRSFFTSGRLVEYARDLLSSGRIKSEGFFDPRQVERLIKRGSTAGSARLGFRDNMAFVIALSTTLLSEHLRSWTTAPQASKAMPERNAL